MQHLLTVQHPHTGKRLKELGEPYTILYHSTMPRAIETAKLISESLPGVPVKSCDLMREGAPIRPEPPSSTTWRPEEYVSTLTLKVAKCHCYTVILFIILFLPRRSFFGTVSGLKQHSGSTFTEPLPARRKTVPRYWSSTPMSFDILCAGKKYDA